MSETIILTIVVAIFGSLNMYLILRSKQKKPEKDPTAEVLTNQINYLQKTFQDQITGLQTSLDQRLDTSSGRLDARLGQDSERLHKLIREITEKVTKVEHGTAQVLSIGDQLKNFEQILKNQKQRGSLGELGLEFVLQNILPANTYKMQHSFQDGQIVDAVINASQGLIPIDSKFPLSNYQKMLDEPDDEKQKLLMKSFRQDVKKRIDETSKYIRPTEGTLGFAFMFIPAEGIYYEMFVNSVGSEDNLVDYSYKKNVIVVSPTTFSAYLQSVLYGFKAFQIEKNAQEIREKVMILEKHFLKHDEYMRLLGSNLGRTVGSFNNAHNELKKVDQDVKKITLNVDGESISPIQIDRPHQE